MKRGRSIAAICRYGNEHGWGHLTRTAALMSEARQRGWRTSLWTASECGELSGDRLEAFGAVERLERYDFEGISKRRLVADALFIDEMYLPDSFFESARRYSDSIGSKLIAMDDMRQRSMASVDMVVNVELGLRKANYESPQEALGESYCLLRSGFRNPRKQGWAKDRDGIPVLIMVGGTDPKMNGLRVLEALQRLSMNGRSFAPVYISGEGRGRQKIDEALEKFPKHRLEVGANDRVLAEWMSRCEFGVIGCGSSVYECAALQRPFVGLLVADNQERTAEAIARLWKLPVARCYENDSPTEAIEEAIARLLARLESGARFDFGTVDPFGSARLMDRIESLFE